MNSIKKDVEMNRKVVHINSKCSECGKSPIEGIRYLCIECVTYELCPECEKKYGEKHGHPLLKLRNKNDLEKFKTYIFKKEDLEKLNKIEEETKLDISKFNSLCTNLKGIYTTKNNNNFIPIEVILKNNGKEKWPSPCFFVCDEGKSQINGERVKISKFTDIGEEIKLKIKINLKNITKTGTYSSYWQLKNEKGMAFGQKFLFIIKDIFESKLKLRNEDELIKKDNKSNNKIIVKIDYRDELENNVKEIKQKYDILFSSSRIRNALIRTKGNKENAIKILYTEKNRNSFYH